MALSINSVDTAWDILNDINPNAANHNIKDFSEYQPLLVNTILGVDEKEDGGWESIFLNVKDISDEQLVKFKKRAKEIPNTSFVRSKGKGITRIGWY